MIYTVTFNPSLDYYVEVDDFKTGYTNRTKTEKLLPGGKGINVSVVLNNLGIVNTSFGFVAGFTGEEIVRQLDSRGIVSEFINVKNGISRINVKMKSIDGTEINGIGPAIDKKYIDELILRLEKLQEGDVLILAGSIPSSVLDNIYEIIAKKMYEKGVDVVVDATKNLLLNVLKYNPFLIKPNNNELEEIFNVKINDKNKALEYAKELQKMGAKNVIISMAQKGAVFVSAEGRSYMAKAPKGQLINGVGAGDSMVAGFVSGWIKSSDYEEAFKLGVAAGSASAFSQDLASAKKISEVYKLVVIEEIANTN